MTLPQIVAAVVFAAACQAIVLRIATRLMVDVRITWRLAAKIAAVEYVAAACAVALVFAFSPAGHAAPLAIGALTYLFVGAACIRTWIVFNDGSGVGMGNGVLIQAIQVPLIIPVLIAGSFLFDLQSRLGTPG